MSTLALDLSSSRLRAVQGVSVADVQGLLLGTGQPELPLAVALDKKTPQIGAAGLALCRRSPHLTCIDFLPHLGDRREWSAGRLRLDASMALSLFLEHIAGLCGKGVRGAILALPSYLSQAQITLAGQLTEKARLRFLGALDATLAAALAAHAADGWIGSALVLDVDSHALTWGLVHSGETDAVLTQVDCFPQLGARIWMEHLLTLLADQFVRQARYDPRDSAEAEQTLFDQVPGLLESLRISREIEVTVELPGRSVVMHGVDLLAAVEPLTAQVLASFEVLHAEAVRQGPLQEIVVTPAAARLPGVVFALEQRLSELLPEFTESRPPWVQVLGEDAVALAAHEVALGLSGPLRQSRAAPWPAVQPAHLGSPRLIFRGRPYALGMAPFAIGRGPGNDLSIDTAEYSFVSGQHCQISCDTGQFVLHDHSRYGTWINEQPVQGAALLQPGDWIRLGPGGPLLRFLGHFPEPGWPRPR